MNKSNLNYPTNRENNGHLIPSVNFHLWEPCNMRCKFCFASFQDVKRTILPKGHLSREKAIQVVRELADHGFKKITFAGGEPTLCPWLSELISLAKELGMTTMLVTNGSEITSQFLEDNKDDLDWIALSIDSLNSSSNVSIGRSINGRSLSSKYYYQLLKDIKRYSYRLKINTVINKYNYAEDMIDFIADANPERWKVMQALPIKGQNDKSIEEVSISGDEFSIFLEKHKDLKSMVSESNDEMRGSYVMVDPAGRFFDNSQGKHVYSKPILEYGVKSAIKEMNYSFTKFEKRGGVYNWEGKDQENNFPSRITISGNVASGKSTVGKILAKKLNYSFTSIGLRTRKFAKENKLSIAEFQKKCLENPLLDKRIDKEFSQECNSLKDLVIDYRLGFHFINSSFNIFLKVSDDVAVQRLKKDQRDNETYHTVGERNESFVKQFEKSYNIDFTSEEHYDLILSADNNSPEEIANLILQKINFN
ncbi:MAG: radical SAM protein [Labilibaculum sp.]|nr:viperin family antiviral radical SAM protein [Labilibaculum sp.]MBI9058288.1 radical SAM protein [Labilibaculum sp.]